MATVDIGTTAAVSWTDAAPSATLTVTAPDGSTTSPSVATSSGKHTAQVPTVQAGRHLLTWTSSLSEKYADILDVWPADPRFLISAEDAAAALRWRPADVAGRGDDLRLYNAAATEVIEDIAGAVLVRTVEQYADGGKTGVALWERPDQVLTVLVDGVAWSGYVVNESAAIVYAAKDGVTRFPDGRQVVKITYRVGAAAIPPSVRGAVRILLRHMVEVDQAPVPVSGGNPAGGASEIVPTRSGFMVPRRVIELVANRWKLPGTS